MILEWAREVKADLVQLQTDASLPALGTVAHMIHEAFNPDGTLSRLASEFNNFAGMKWASWQADFGGRPVSMATWEEIDGQTVDLTNAFAAFPSWEHWLQAYRALLTGSRYGGARQYYRDPLLWMHQVWSAGYATDSRYLLGVGRWMTAVWPIYADTLPAPVAPGRPVPILDAGGRQLCTGWLQDPDGPGPEPERTVVRLRDLAEAQGQVVQFDAGGPAVTLSWPGAKETK